MPPVENEDHIAKLDSLYMDVMLGGAVLGTYILGNIWQCRLCPNPAGSLSFFLPIFKNCTPHLWWESPAFCLCDIPYCQLCNICHIHVCAILFMPFWNEVCALMCAYMTTIIYFLCYSIQLIWSHHTYISLCKFLTFMQCDLVQLVVFLQSLQMTAWKVAWKLGCWNILNVQKNWKIVYRNEKRVLLMFFAVSVTSYFT